MEMSLPIRINMNPSLSSADARWRDVYIDRARPELHMSGIVAGYHDVDSFHPFDIETTSDNTPVEEEMLKYASSRMKHQEQRDMLRMNISRSVIAPSARMTNSFSSVFNTSRFESDNMERVSKRRLSKIDIPTLKSICKALGIQVKGKTCMVDSIHSWDVDSMPDMAIRLLCKHLLPGMSKSNIEMMKHALKSC